MEMSVDQSIARYCNAATPLWRSTVAQLIQTLIGLLSSTRESDLEHYLARSANLADVERRTREWEASHGKSQFTWP
jgi:hypothetical protein